ncbi:MAG: polysaccharide deacetylase family protein [Synechococcaceae cyanobacterium SM2_3_1]|nr:polysaccharide deacetylase family protein [Synechococcaceae cyanobacterium SM2_3_1]
MYHDVVGTYKQVWFDTTEAELREHFEAIQEAGVVPISIDQLYAHLRNGDPLPEKAILLTFDDAYLGQYENAYRLLQEYQFPATYFVQTGFVGVPTSKDHFTWEQMREMDRSGLITFAPHTINHPEDLRLLADDRLRRELVEAKQRMEAELGHDMNYFAYPAGNRDERVIQAVKDAGYTMAVTMDSGFTGQSSNLLEVRRFNQFRLTEALVGARTLVNLSLPTYELEVTSPLEVIPEVIDRVKATTIRGGRPATVHANQRYDVSTLMRRYQAPAGINGSFFSIPWINSASNIMVGPVLSANTGMFIPGREEDIQVIRGRPLVLLGQDRVSFVPFEPDTMNSLEGVQSLMPDVTDLFVAGTWLVKDGQPLNRAQMDSFRLSSAAEFRPRAFFGVDQQGRTVLGTTQTHIDATILAQILPKTGIQEAVLLDSGFSTSLIYKDEILATGHATAEQPSRPVPHAILLYDLPELWAEAQDASVTAEFSKLDLLTQLLPEAQQGAARQRLNAVLAGEQILQRRERGVAIVALQLALARVAAGQGRSDLLPSGADGVYGNEVAEALVALGLSGSGPGELTAAGQGATVATYSREQGSLSSVTETGAEQVDSRTLQALLDRFQAAPPAVLVSRTVPKRVQDFTRKPVHKLLS